MLPEDISDTVGRALAEDIGSGDLTAALIPPDRRAKASVITRENAVLCGTAWFDEVFRQLDRAIRVSWQAQDGDRIHAGQTVCAIEGPARTILSGERMALNFLQLLSGVATQAREYVDRVSGTPAKILDTRKTVPGLRKAQKYAVTCGGAHNHRMGLYDGILIKENHILAAGSIAAAVQRAKASAPEGTPIEIEVESLDELEQAIEAGADNLLIDNFSLDDLRTAVERARGRATLEASGGISRDNVRQIAETGVDYISIGDMTKNVKAVDFSMRFAPRGHTAP